MGSRRGFWYCAVAAVMAVAGALALGGSVPAMAATTVGSFPAWTAPSVGHFDATFSAATNGFPSAHVITDDPGASVASGKSAFLGQTTGFGQRFGSSRLQPYLNVSSLGAGTSASTTTITFDSTTPVGWGLALGDVDADYVTISALGAGGVPLTSGELGAQNTSNVPPLNYCANASPRPTPCPASGEPYTDVPVWCPTGAPAPCPAVPANTVLGHGSDTAGAYDWFVPTVGVDSITLVFTPQAGNPVFQLWLVAPADATTVTGSVAGAPPGTAVELLDTTGVPVPDEQGDPVLEPVVGGDFSLVSEDGAYQLAVLPPAGFELADPAASPLSFTAGGGALNLGAVAAVQAIPAAPAAPPELAPTGPPAALGVLLAGGLFVVVGALLMAIALYRARQRCMPA